MMARTRPLRPSSPCRRSIGVATGGGAGSGGGSGRGSTGGSVTAKSEQVSNVVRSTLPKVPMSKKDMGDLVYANACLCDTILPDLPKSHN